VGGTQPGGVIGDSDARLGGSDLRLKWWSYSYADCGLIQD